jgi:protoporphyrinogen oxidase
MSGLAAAYALALTGFYHVTIVERGEEVGGLAGSFERDGHFYPLGYHHILHRSRTLLYFLELIGALDRVRWRRIRMLFRTGNALYDLASPLGALRFPMRPLDKLRFARLMMRVRNKDDWSDWQGKSAQELLDKWAGHGVRRALFEPLTRLKFDLPCSEVSAAWLGARLYFREGIAPLGYIPGANWTRVLCDGLRRLCEDAGVKILLRSQVTALETKGDRMHDVCLADGNRLGADLFVSTMPTVVYSGLVADQTPHLAAIRYTALLSVVCATRQWIEPDFYWMNLADRGYKAGGIFLLNSLNPSIGAKGENCVNFVTHLHDSARSALAQSDDDLLSAYASDFRAIFGSEFAPSWAHIARVSLYSPIFVRDYQNPPVRSTSFSNVFFAGNFRTFPSISSIGTALDSGIEAAQAILSGHGRTSEVLDASRAFRFPGFVRE